MSGTVLSRHTPALPQKIGDIKFSGFAAVARIDPHDPWRGAFDGGE
jgi:hypothetical protein